MSDGTKNLKPCRTKEEARERGRKGGKASVIARREKKTAKQIAIELLEEQITNPQGESATRKLAILASQINKAQKGDLKSAQFLLELADEYKQDQVTLAIGQRMSKEEAYSIIYGD